MSSMWGKHWIIEALRFEKTSKIKSDLWPNTTMAINPYHSVSYPVISQTLPPLPWAVKWFHHFPGQSAPMLYHHFSEDTLLDVQPKPPPPPSFQAVVESDQVYSESSFLEAKHQLPQLLRIWLTPQTLQPACTVIQYQQLCHVHEELEQNR